MAQSVNLWGATYSNVPAIEVPKSGGGTASFTDVTDTTATASDVASGKYFYTAAGVKTQGTSTSGGYITQDANGYVVLSPTSGLPTLITKSITANGTYNASSDNASGYSSVTVNVQASGGTMTASTNCAVSTWIYTNDTLTFSNIASSPNQFILMLTTQPLNGYPNQYGVATYGDYALYVVYNGTVTRGCWVIGVSNGYQVIISEPDTSSGEAITWTYNSSAHTLALRLQSTTEKHFLDADPTLYTTTTPPYTLYYL